jgi:hypothetical protein
VYPGALDRRSDGELLGALALLILFLAVRFHALVLAGLTTLLMLLLALLLIGIVLV